jgi:hypothetical protein
MKFGQNYLRQSEAASLAAFGGPMLVRGRHGRALHE